MLPVFVQLAQKLPQFTFYIMQAPSIGTDYYAGFIEKEMNVKLIKNQDFNFIKYLDAAVVTSGTATLQVALHQVPQVVCYKTDPLLYNIAKRIIKVDYISIVNIVLNRPFLKELIQKDCNVDNLFKEIYALLNLKEDTLRIRQGYKDLYTILTKGNASENTASAILKALN
jgi:lipid-A-disaccharide synthase